MKKFITVLLMCMLILPCAASARDVAVYIDGELLLTDVPAKIVDDRTVLPMRAIFEKLGATVTWMEEDRIIFATKDSLLVIMQIDNSKMSVQDVATDKNTVLELDRPPFIQNERTLVPVRAVAESLGAHVEWDADTYTVNITTK